MAGILIGKHTEIWLFAALSAVPAVAGIPLCGRKHPLMRRILIALLACAVGTLMGYRTWHPALPEERVWHVTGVVVEEIRSSDNTQHKTLLQNVTLDGKPWRGGAYWSFYMAEKPDSLQPGMKVEGDFRLYHPSGADNPGGFDFREYLLQKNVRIGLYGNTGLTVPGPSYSVNGRLAALRHALTARLCAVMEEQAGGYAATMLLGVRNLVPNDDRDAFSRLGIAHILSVSGFHVAVLYDLLVRLLRTLRLSRRARLPILTLLLAAYCILAGMGAPVVRASILILLREYGLLRHRPSEGLHLLSLAAIITLLIMPAQLTSAGFHLSYAALLSLILIRPFLIGERKIGSFRERHRWANRLWIAAMSSLAVQLGILLPQLYWYQELPLLSVVLNIFVLALAAVLLNGYWVLLFVMWVPYIGPFLGQIAAWVTELMTRGVRLLADRDWITLWTRQANLLTAAGWLLIGLGLCYLWQMKKSRRVILTAAGTLAVILSLISWPHRGTDYIQLSTGSADSAVLRDGHVVWVIDTGEDATLSTYLHQRRLSVDTLVITHLHTDHVLGICELVNDRIPVRRLILPEGAEEQAVTPECLNVVELLRERGTEIVRVKRGDRLELPSGSMTVLWPEHERIRRGHDANDYSLAMIFDLQGVRMLTAGDLTGTYEMYAAQPADLLKASHHGSKASNAPEFLQTVSPQAILLSGGDETRLRSLSERAGAIPVWATQERGALAVRFESGEFTVRGYHDPVLSGIE